jgi:hypothetical protein
MSENGNIEIIQEGAIVDCDNDIVSFDVTVHQSRSNLLAINTET